MRRPASRPAPSRHPSSRQPSSRRSVPPALALALAGCALAGLGSAVVLAWRGRIDNGTAMSGVNPPSHWLWGDDGIYQDHVSTRYTLAGLAVHQASALLWSAVYGLIRTRRRRPGAGNAVSDAVAVTALAAVVDLQVAPHRLTPGFEERLSGRSLGWVYGSFAAGLALAGIAAVLRRSPGR